MSEQNPQDKQDKQYVTEWSFSFDKIGESINKLLSSVGVSETEVKTAQFSEPADKALAATVNLGAVVGQIAVSALTASDNLFEAEVSYVGEMEFNVSGDTEKVIRLNQKMRDVPVTDQFKKVLNQFANRDDLYWKVGISPDVPVKFNIEGSVGVAKFDLSGLRVADVELEGGVGETFLNLPASSSRYAVKVSGGVGASHITIADGAALNLKVDGGVGGVEVHVPATAAIRVEADGGLGGVSVPAGFKRVRGGDNFIGTSGVWETEGFNIADKQIYIHFNGGVGGLKVIV
ncbi:MAG TPA: hypothetical protein VHO69_19335 [Phototrophicaceae bacterium]|nr:hypothetical protein [Phototrophicaceae bacterium]